LAASIASRRPLSLASATISGTGSLLVGFAEKKRSLFLLTFLFGFLPILLAHHEPFEELLPCCFFDS
jgi:hypothetical protein